MTIKKDPLSDFKDLIRIANRYKVKFLVVGAHAMSQYGYTRATGDLDILVLPVLENLNRLLIVLKEFGTPLRNLQVEDFLKEGTVLQIGVPPLRVDILTGIDGISSETAFKESKRGKLLGECVRFLSFEHLVKNKQTTGRPKDKLDVLVLKDLKKKRKKKR